jgi:hypothetical protein
MTTTVRKQKSGDQLTVGDWLAPDQVTDGAAEVLFAHAYPASADGSRDNDGKHVQLSVREQGKLVPYGTTVAGTTLFDLASDEDLAALRAAAERAQKIADIRALADWLESTPGVPVPSVSGQVSPGHETLPHLDVWNSGVEGVAELRRLAGLMGAEVVSDDERTWATKTFGDCEYRAIAWHKDGRPAEPKPGTTCEELADEDPTGLLHSRADDADDPTPVSPARVPLHTGGVVDGGQLVDETAAPQDRRTYEDVVAEEQERERLLVAADTVPVPAEDATLTALPEPEPQCTPDCDALHVPGAPTGLARGFHHDACPLVPVLEAADRERLAEFEGEVR